MAARRHRCLRADRRACRLRRRIDRCDRIRRGSIRRATFESRSSGDPAGLRWSCRLRCRIARCDGIRRGSIRRATFESRSSGGPAGLRRSEVRGNVPLGAAPAVSQCSGVGPARYVLCGGRGVGLIAPRFVDLDPVLFESIFSRSLLRLQRLSEPTRLGSRFSIAPVRASRSLQRALFRRRTSCRCALLRQLCSSGSTRKPG